MNYVRAKGLNENHMSTEQCVLESIHPFRDTLKK